MERGAVVWKLGRRTMSAYIPAQWEEECGEKIVPT